MPPGFTCINRKTSEEQEATTQYETPADSQKQSINEELGIQDVTDINEDWYPPPESELASSIQNLLDSQPMEVDNPPEEQLYQMFDKASDVLGLEPGLGSPVAALEDSVLDTPGRFSRAPGEGRPITGSVAGSSGHKITGRTTEG